MAGEVVMPSMGADMEEGTLVRWLKKPGDPVQRGDAIAEIETDKATVDLEAFEDGVFQRSVVDEGAKVPVDTVIAYIAKPGEAQQAGAATPPQPATDAAPQAAASAGAAEAPAQPSAAPEDASPSLSQTQHVQASRSSAQAVPHPSPAARTEQAAPQPPRPAGGRLRASPVARSIAAELGIDLAGVRGTGPDGRIVRRDVEAAAAKRPEEGLTAKVSEPEPATVQWEEEPHENGAAPRGQPRPLSRMRQAIARRMAESKRTAPHYYVTVDADMTDAMAFRAQLNAAGGNDTHVTVNDLLVKAAAQALENFPGFNASYSEQGLILHEQINISIAVATEDGLVAPAIIDCGGKSLGWIAAKTRDLSERARAGHLRPNELADGTFTISNLGAYGIETLIPIIQPPQAAIIGAGMVQSQPVVHDGQIVVREMLKLALSADHRVTNGAEGAGFLREVKAALEAPFRLAL